MRSARPPASTIADEGAAAAAPNEHRRGAATVAAAALAINGPELCFSARDAFAEAFALNETAVRPSDYAAWMKKTASLAAAAAE